MILSLASSATESTGALFPHRSTSSELRLCAHGESKNPDAYELYSKPEVSYPSLNGCQLLTHQLRLSD